MFLPEKKFRPAITGFFPKAPAMHENYRRYQRYSVSARALLTRRDTGSPERLTTQVTTISQGGMGFYASTPLEKTTPVSIELLIGNPVLEILDGKIASISSQGDNYFIGIALTGKFPMNGSSKSSADIYNAFTHLRFHCFAASL